METKVRKLQLNFETELVFGSTEPCMRLDITCNGLRFVAFNTPVIDEAAMHLSWKWEAVIGNVA